MSDDRKNAYRTAYLKRAEWVVRAIEEDCESELERLFALALLQQIDPAPAIIPTDMRQRLGGNRATLYTQPAALWPVATFDDGRKPCVSFATRRHFRTDWGGPVWIVPQMEIEAGGKGYRADFAFLPEAGTACPPFVVELDGHNFHERTKEQAARDRLRDRNMQACGWQVLRFTGSEVWRDPGKCILDVYAAMLWEELRRSPADWGYLRQALEIATVAE